MRGLNSLNDGYVALRSPSRIDTSTAGTTYLGYKIGEDVYHLKKIVEADGEITIFESVTPVAWADRITVEYKEENHGA